MNHSAELRQALLDLDVDLLSDLVLPDAAFIVGNAPLFLLYGLAAAALATRLRVHRDVRTPYTRKVFHFTIFTGAGVIQVVGGLPGVVLFGTIVCSLVLHAVWRGEGYGLYEAMARPTDRPHRSLFIIVPMITTAVGGAICNLLVGPFASVGYMACGWGDAIGEPVGTRWGRHRYSVPSLGGVPAQRSLEGSIAVCLVGALACTLALVALGFATGTAVAVGAACGVAGALVEAVSNHGLDNLTIQVAAASVAWALLR